nr:protein DETOXIFICATION 9-like isoform X1 [Coffea arabica]
MSGALETLCGQAFGAEQYQRLGTYTYGAIICLFIVCIPISLLWMFTDKLLILTGQDPAIATEAGKYLIWLIPTLFPYAILQSLVRFLQTQSLVFPMLLSTVASVSLQLPLCWVLVFKLKLGNAGAALSIGISYWLNAILLVLYVKYSSSCRKTRVPFSMDALQTMGGFFRFAIPSTVMTCLEWWAYELVVLLSGLSPNLKLETSVLSICLTITSLHYLIAYSFGVAASGSKMKWMAALRSLWKSWGILSGWNSCGFNIGICTAFKRNGSVEWTGRWSHGESLLLSIITGLTNWEKQVIEARSRIYEGEEERATPV